MKFLIPLVLGLGFFACGVKGPPLPPVADTPANSDRVDVAGPVPSPTPTTSPAPKKKKNR